MMSLAPLPSAIVESCDFNDHAVCETCEEHLRRNADAPMIEFEAISSKAAIGFGSQALEAVRNSRARLLHHVYFYLPGCRSAAFLYPWIINCVVN